ncbi:hypothetical protein F4778DRAFT_753633, partial [Xylariomycetidae sp. FL2044]
MCSILLFCIADEAKSFLPTVMATESMNYSLVESRRSPSPRHEYRDKLAEGDAFGDEFIGASMDECAAFTLEHQGKSNKLHRNLMVIVDARSAKDGTIIISYHPFPENAPFLGQNQKVDAWYSFRIHYTTALDLSAELSDTGRPSETYGVLFRRKDELTNEKGIFDYDKAGELLNRGEGVILEESQST